MEWITVAEGDSFFNLSRFTSDMELPKGTKVRVIMDWRPPLDKILDLAGMEHVFAPLVPQGLDLIDVYSEGGRGIVDMEADPAWLAPVLIWIGAHWSSIAITSGLVLAVLGLAILWIRVLVLLPQEPIRDIQEWAKYAIIGLIVVGVLYVVSKTAPSIATGVKETRKRLA